jgi:hypothetical protein
MWKWTEWLSGEDKITDGAVNLFYEQMDALVQKRIDAVAAGYKHNPDEGVDLLDLFMQSTSDAYSLSGMVFAFLIAGRMSNLSTSRRRPRHHADLASFSLGDTTAYSTSWLMKEIFHNDNRHLDAVHKIRSEATEVIAQGSYLEYADTQVRIISNIFLEPEPRPV